MNNYSNEEVLCPSCYKEGKSVHLKTIYSMLLNKTVLKSTRYSICLTDNCTTAYFSDLEIIRINQIKEVIYSKSIRKDKILCYCSRTTEDEILKYLKSSGKTTLKDVVQNTTAMNNSNCVMNSPTGKCCSTQINESIKNHLNS